jgi:16S rRNA (adenine1518-N6/adenine1519-N6)-dimethyltransferase
MFYPQPEVDSIIIRLTKRDAAPFTVIDVELFKRMLRQIFAERNKKVINAVVPFIRNERGMSAEEAKKLACSLPFHEERVRTLPPEDFGELANALIT